MEQKKKKIGFEGCEIEYNVDPPEQHRRGRGDSIYGPFLTRFVEDEDALTIRVKADSKEQARNISLGLKNAAIRAGYSNINIRRINNVYVYLSKEE